LDEIQQFQSGFNDFKDFMNKVNNRFLATSIRERVKRHVIYSREKKKKEKGKQGLGVCS
jgi:hypothetical protein